MANEKIKQNYRDIADAIRSKTGGNNLMSADEMPDEIRSIPTGGTDTSLLPEFFVPFVDVSDWGADGVLELQEFIRLIEAGREIDFAELCDFLTNLKFKAKFPLSNETRDQLEDVIIYLTEATSEISLDISYYPVNDSSKKYCITVSIESDSETADMRYVFDEIYPAEE